MPVKFEFKRLFICQNKITGEDYAIIFWPVQEDISFNADSTPPRVARAVIITGLAVTVDWYTNKDFDGEVEKVKRNCFEYYDL